MAEEGAGFIAVFDIATDVGYSILAIAIIGTLGRLFLRRKYARLDWDDLFNCLALICLIGYYAIPNESDVTTPAFWKGSLASMMLSWTVLWLVKASFLSLYWTIFKVSPSFRKAWVVITIYTCFAFFPPFLSTLWQCDSPSNYADPVVCTAFAAFNSTYLLYINAMNLCLHVSTEVLILALPVAYIRKLQMSKAQKVNAAAIFLAAVITIVVGIISNATGICYEDICRYIQQVTFVFEAPLAVLVCALPPHKILLSKFQKRKEALAARPQQGSSEDLRSPPRKKPMRVVKVQDSITELEMPIP